MAEELTVSETEIPDSITKQAKAAEDAQSKIIQGESQKTVKPAQEPVAPKVEDDKLKTIEESFKKLEHKHNVLQGKYNAEITQLRNIIAEKDKDIASANETISGLNKIVQEKPENTFDVNPDDFDHLGEEFVGLLSKIKEHINQPKSVDLSDITNSLKNLESKVETTEVQIQETRDEKWNREMNNEVSDWRTINKTPEFVDWLQEMDPLTGMTRQAILNNAYSNRNVSRCAAMFKAFKDDNKQPSTPNLKKEEFVIPDTSGSGEDTPRPVAEQVTSQQAKDAASNYQQGRISEADAMAIINKYQEQLRAAA